MSILGNAGSIYMIILILLLIIGLGLIIKGLYQFIVGAYKKQVKINGGDFMQNQNNGWLKLSVFSFIGIVLALMILSFISPYGNSGTSMTGMNMQNDDPMMYSSMGNVSSNNGSSNISSNTGMTNMGSMMNMSTPMTQTSTSNADLSSIIQALNQMQLQINQLQQQVMIMSSGSVQMSTSMPQSSMSNMSGTTDPSGMSGMGMMSMMPMNNMSGMSSGGTTGTSGTMSGGTSSGSSGGMGMM